MAIIVAVVLFQAQSDQLFLMKKKVKFLISDEEYFEDLLKFISRNWGFRRLRISSKYRFLSSDSIFSVVIVVIQR